MMTTEEYREEVLKAIRNYEKQFNRISASDVSTEIGFLYEIIRAIPTDRK